MDEELRELLASGGFRLARTLPTGTPMGIIECLPMEGRVGRWIPR